MRILFNPDCSIQQTPEGKKIFLSKSNKMSKVDIFFIVNGNSVKISVLPDKTLVDVLREDLKLTGTKAGCRGGECGACTVIMDGKPVNSCLVFAGQLEGKEVLTIESLSKGEEVHPIQQAFIEEGAVQCGFCIPGMIMTTKALLDSNPEPAEVEIKEALSGNLCRCTGYIKIFKAVKKASEKLRLTETLR
jgi:aerobic carbon-monoxide dehydrogenase small subunit